MAVAALLMIVFVRKPHVMLAFIAMGYYPYFWVMSATGIPITSVTTGSFLLVVFIFMLGTVLSGPRIRIRRLPNALVVAVGSMAVVTWLAKALMVGEPRHWVELAWMFPLMLGPYFAAQSLGREGVHSFCRWIVGLSALFGFIMTFYAVTGAGLATVEQRLTPFEGSFNPITAAYLLAYGPVLTYPLIASRPTLMWGAAWLIWTGTAAWLILLTGTRQVVLFVPVVLLILSAADWAYASRLPGVTRLSRAMLAAIVSSGIIVGLVALATLQGEVGEVFFGVRRSLQVFASWEAVADSRLALWRAIAGQGPWLVFGMGFGGSYEAVGATGGAHNILLEALADYGLAGVAVISALLITVTARAARLLRTTTWWQRGLGGLWLLALLNAMVSGRMTGMASLWALAGSVVGVEPRSEAQVSGGQAHRHEPCLRGA